METLKKYLPFIVIAILGFYAIRKLSSGSSGASTQRVIPLTPTREPSYTDPLLPFRAGAFAQLADVAKSQIEGDTARDLAQKQKEIESFRISSGLESSRYNFDLSRILGLQELNVRQILGLSGQETTRDVARVESDLQKALEAARNAQQQFLQNSYLQQLGLFYASREQDRQLQQSAINRAISSQNTGGILNSINAALQSIFRPRSGNIYGTPSTFPTGFGVSGGYYPQYDDYSFLNNPSSFDGTDFSFGF